MSNFDDNDNLFDDDLFGDDDDFGGDDDFALGDDDLFADDTSGGGFDDEFDDFASDEFGAASAADGFGDDDFGFDDDLGGLDDGDLDEELILGGDDPTGLGTVQEEEGGGSGFGLWAGILGGLLALQLITIAAFFLLRPPPGPTDFDLTATERTNINATTLAQATNQAGTAVAVQATADAVGSITPTPSLTNTLRPTFTPTSEPTVDPTDEAGTAFARVQTSEAEGTLSAEQTQAATTPSPTPIPELDIEGTSTALAQTFLEITQTFEARTPSGDGNIGGEGGGPDAATPTTAPVVAPGDGDGTGLINQDQLPDAGLFDDFAAGSSLGLIALAAFGLVGVIVFTRRTRLRDDEDK